MNFKDELDELNTIKVTFENNLDSQCLYHVQLFCEKMFKKLNKSCKWSIFNNLNDKDFGHCIINKTTLQIFKKVVTKNENGLCLLNKNIIKSKINKKMFHRNEIIAIFSNILNNKIKTYDEIKDKIKKCFKYMELFYSSLTLFDSNKLCEKSNEHYVEELVKEIPKELNKIFICKNKTLKLNKSKFSVTFGNDKSNLKIETMRTIILNQLFIIGSLLGLINNLARYGFDENDPNGVNIVSAREFIEKLKLKDGDMKYFVESCENIFNVVFIYFHESLD